MSLVYWVSNKISSKPNPKSHIELQQSKEKEYKANIMRKKRKKSSIVDNNDNTPKATQKNSEKKLKRKRNKLNDDRVINVLDEIEREKINIFDKQQNFKLDIIINKHLQNDYTEFIIVNKYGHKQIMPKKLKKIRARVRNWHKKRKTRRINYIMNNFW
eukprot:172236_1